MLRYQKLIQDEVKRLYGLAEQQRIDRLGDAFKPDTKNKGYADLARSLETPSTSIHEWATFPGKVPQYKSLVKLAAYFKVPVPTLLMEATETASHDDQIIDALCRMDEGQKARVIEYIRTLG